VTFLRRFSRRSRPDKELSRWLGVHAGAHQVFVAEAARGDGQPTVRSCRRFEGVEAMDAMLSWQRQVAWRYARTNLLLDGGDYQILLIDEPKVEPAERNSAARWLIKDMIDYPVEQAAVQCLVLPGSDDSPLAQRRLLTVVSRKQTAFEWMNRWQRSRMALTSIDIPELALRNLAVLASGPAAVAFLHVGIDHANLIMVWQEDLCTFRRLDVSALMLHDSVAEKRESLVERLGLEVQRTADAFGRQFHAADLTQLWVSSVDDAVGLCDALSRQIYLKAQPFVLGDWVKFETDAPPYDIQLGIDYTLAIGAALRQEA